MCGNGLVKSYHATLSSITSAYTSITWRHWSWNKIYQSAKPDYKYSLEKSINLGGVVTCIINCAVSFYEKGDQNRQMIGKPSRLSAAAPEFVPRGYMSQQPEVMVIFLSSF